MTPETNEQFLELVKKSGLLEDKRLETFLQQARERNALPAEPSKLANSMVQEGLLTRFQAMNLLKGKYHGFHIGAYRVLEVIGTGGMGNVYLCEHKKMRRRVAVKVLSRGKADDPTSIKRFYREARAAAALEHPNIVRAYDVDQDNDLHYLVMDYVEGASLQQIVEKLGPLEVNRAAHYLRQAALGLQHAHEAGLIHRDVKPSNLMLDRQGTLKLLDLSVARFFEEEGDVLTQRVVLGSADYLAPEQAVDSHKVDVRADVYSLGATFYFVLTGIPPFDEGKNFAQKLMMQQTQKPKAMRQLRPEVPETLEAIIEKMMAKSPGDRYQTAAEVAEALGPLTQQPIAPPPSKEMPRLSLAAKARSVEPAKAASDSSSVLKQKPAASAPAAPAKSLPLPKPAAAAGPATPKPMPAPAPSKSLPLPKPTAATPRPMPTPVNPSTPPPRAAAAVSPAKITSQGFTLVPETPLGDPQGLIDTNVGPSPTEPEAPAPPETPPAPRRRRRWLWWLLLLVLIFGIGGGVGVAALWSLYLRNVMPL